MRRLLFAAVLALCVSPASAWVTCSPWPGLTFQQWYNVCASALRQNYAAGIATNMDWNTYVNRMYAIYSQPVRAPGGGNGGGNYNVYLCQPGATQCFNHWLRTCQRMAAGGSWWITSSRQCP